MHHPSLTCAQVQKFITEPRRYNTLINLSQLLQVINMTFHWQDLTSIQTWVHNAWSFQLCKSLLKLVNSDAFGTSLTFIISVTSARHFHGCEWRWPSENSWWGHQWVQHWSQAEDMYACGCVFNDWICHNTSFVLEYGRYSCHVAYQVFADFQLWGCSA